MVGFESQMVIRFHRIVAGILKLVREKLIHQSDAAAFLKLVNHDAAAALADRIQRKVQLFAAIASLGAENVASQALGMEPNQRRIVGCGFSHDESEHIFRFVFRFEAEELEGSKRRRQVRLRNLCNFHQADKYITGLAVVRSRQCHPLYRAGRRVRPSGR